MSSDRDVERSRARRFSTIAWEICYKCYKTDTTVRNLDPNAYRALRARAVLEGKTPGISWARSGEAGRGNTARIATGAVPGGQ